MRVLYFSFNLKRTHLKDKENIGIFRCIPCERILQKRRDSRIYIHDIGAVDTLIVKSDAFYARYSDAINETNVLSYRIRYCNDKKHSLDTGVDISMLENCSYCLIFLFIQNLKQAFICKYRDFDVVHTRFVRKLLSINISLIS